MTDSGLFLSSSPVVSVLGAGSIGFLYGIHLARHCRVTLIGHNPERIRSIRDHGILFRENETERRIYPVPITLSGMLSESPDLVLVTLKAHQIQQAVEENKSLFMAGDPIVCLLMNGGDNARFFKNLVPRERLVLATTTHNAMTLPGNCIQHTAGGITTLGPDGPAVHFTARLLADSGFTTEIDPDIHRIIWKKLFVNAVINPLTAIHGVRNGEIARNPQYVPQIRGILEECLHAARCEGFDFEENEILHHILHIAENTALGESSMLQDLHHGKTTEIDEINGFIAEICEKHSLPCPYNRELVKQVHSLEQKAL